jgi:hypothetical protein
MAVRNTAYVHHNHLTAAGEPITVDLYVLWPEGYDTGLCDALNAALGELARQLPMRGQRAS